ncbi:DNA polymerase III subunit alpha [bacterium]|nr:DNA polymerase III subunit alpha [bacterium]
MFLIYDTETTGLPKNYNAPLSDFDNWPRLVQIAWQLHDENGHLLDAQNIIVQPDGFTIPYSAEKIHGISNQRALDEGRPLAEVLHAFNEVVKKANYIVGHNIEFDVNIVGSEYLRCQIESDLTERTQLDTKNETIDFCALPGGRGGRFKFPTLSELHEKLFGSRFEDAHNAAADVEATARCFFKLVHIKVIERSDIAIDEQIMEHLAQVAKQILSSIDYSNEQQRDDTLEIDKEAAKDIDAAFVHLHNHTQYSVLQATTELNAMIQKAAADGMPAIAMTDMGNMYGAFKFVSAALKAKIKPIVGCELNVCADMYNTNMKDNGNHMVFLAKNKRGYHNLARLSTLAMVEGFYYVPRIDKKTILQNKEDLIVISGGLFGEIAHLVLNVGEEQAEEAVLWWKEHFGDDFYLELNRHGLEEENHLNEVLLRFAKKHSIKVVAANNSYYLNKENAFAHDVLLCVKDNELVETPKRYFGRKGRDARFGFPNDEFYVKTQHEMKALFTDIPEAIENIQEILDKTEEYKLESDVLLPKFNIPDEFKDPEDEKDGGKRGENNYLRHLTLEGARKRYGEITPDIAERLDFELETIARTGYPGYFLIVQDFCDQARKMGVSVGPGRGSAAGSAVAYCIGITNVDPIKYDLLFERFLNPERVSMPDIDIDFDDERRQWIIDWVVEKYGKTQVSQIITYGTMAAKSAIRDTARVMNLPLSEADQLAKLVPDVSLSKIFGPRDALKSKLNSEGMQKADELIKIAETDTTLKGDTIKQAKVLEGSVRNTGMHACGVIIAPSPLIDHVPMSKAKDSELLVTQFDNSVVESAGLLKMDFLGLKTLTIIRDAIAIIKERHGVEINPDDISPEDEKTYELYQRGETNGTFQFESAGMQKYLKELKPDRFEDLIAMNALYRPGPLEYIPNFIARKHGREEIVYDTPEMEEFLAETYGITVYQEQVMLLSQKMAGFSKGQADALRKGMGKKKKEILDELKPKFLAGCESNGISAEKAEKVWKDWEAFAAYAFNKSHSTCYSVVAFHTAYLKANYPAEYMASVLTHNMSDIKKVTFFMEECKRMGIEVLGPDVNESFKKFTVNKDGQIRFGLGGVKGVGESAVEAIVEERDANGPYKDIWDFATRVNLRAVNKKCFESLAYAGGFDFDSNYSRSTYFHISPGEKYTLIEKSIRFGNEVKAIEASSTGSLFGEQEDATLTAPKVDTIDEWALMEKLEREKEVIGFYISGHPLDTYKHEIECFTTTNLFELQEKKVGIYTVAGIVTSAVHRISKNGNKFGQLTIEDYHGSHSMMAFKESYLKFQHFFKEGEILLLKLSVEQDRFRNPPELTTKIMEVMQMEEARERIPKELTITLNLQSISSTMVNDLGRLINENPGNSTLMVNVLHEAEKMSLPLRSHKKKVEINNRFLGTLKEYELNFQLTKTK